MVWVNDFLDGQSRRLSGIERYNTTPRIKSENVAEHSFWVAFTSMILMDYLEKEKGYIFVEDGKAQILQRALMHDIEESFSGDAPAVLKRKGNGIVKEAMQVINVGIVRDMLEVIPNDNVADVLRDNMFYRWESSKSDVHGIVAIADKLSAVFYAMQEVRMGNTYFRSILANLITILGEHLDHEWFQEIFEDIIHRTTEEFSLDLRKEQTLV
jgi:5'-deoxynucleotidase YfbR-like HD superfamily hydrolase